jgi:glycosyltransferase involved in cell wall biosynthesis
MYFGWENTLIFKVEMVLFLMKKKIIIFTDTVDVQVNGVAISIKETKRELERLGYEVKVVDPDYFKLKMRFILYPDIILVKPSGRVVAKVFESFKPDYVHIATEGGVGISARKYCDKNKISYTTAYHTDWPLYMKMYFSFLGRYSVKFVNVLTWKIVRRFHSRAKRIYCSTDEIKKELVQNGFDEKMIHRWSKGVDVDNFRIGKFVRPKDLPKKMKRPIGIYFGRVAKEKGIEDFLEISNKILPTKIVVGDGPVRKKLEREYANDGVYFVGMKTHEEMPAYLSVADVFINPAKTETFGMTIVEALACGVPVVAYPVKGPKNVIGNSGCGVLVDDLEKGVPEALKISRKKCRSYVMKNFNWKKTTEQFLEGFDEKGK